MRETTMDDVGFFKPGQSDVEKFRRFPLRRIQPVLKRFFTIIQLNLDRLQQHRQNIEKLVSGSSDLIREHVYALRSVEQLVSTLKQIKQTRIQVDVDDLEVFDLQLLEVLNGAVLITAQFLVLLCDGRHKDQTDVLPPESPATGVSATLEDMTHCAICTDRFVDPRGLPCMHTFCLRCLQQYTKEKVCGSSLICPICRKDFLIPVGGVEAIPKNFIMGQLLTMGEGEKKELKVEAVKADDEQTAQRSAEEEEKAKALESKLREFNNLIQELFSLIESRDSGLQSASLATVEQNTGINLSNFKLLLLPVAGAVIGGALAGPVGLVAGLKAGKVAAVGGGLLGLTGGTILKRKQTTERTSSLDEANEDAMELNHVRSASSPALSTNAPRQKSISESSCEK